MDCTGDQIFDLFGKPNDIKEIELRIKQLKEIYENDKGEPYKLINFSYPNGPKLVGELQSKIDFRLDEVNLSGIRALPGLPPPVHPLKHKAIKHLSIVVCGMITEEKLQEILDFVKGNGPRVWSLSYKDKNPPRKSKGHLKEMIQLLVGGQVDVYWKNLELCVEKSKKTSNQLSTLTWMWPHSFVSFVLSSMKNTTPLKNFHWLRTQSTMYNSIYSNVFAEAHRKEPDYISWSLNGCASNFKFSAHPMIGQKGHIIRFAVRNLTISEENLTTIMQGFEKNGYINYIKMIPAQAGMLESGKMLALGMLKEAVEAILSPCAETRLFIQELMKALFFVFQNAKPLLSVRFTQESALYTIMEAISKEGLNEKAVLEILQNPLMCDLVEHGNSFVNLIWNKTVDKLIEKRGLKLVVGDLVFSTLVSEQRLLYVKESGACVEKMKIKEEELISRIIPKAVRPLTQADIDSGKYSIFDLVIPVCGSCVIWPQNDIGNYIDEVLQEYGINGKDNFKKIHAPPLPFNFIFQGTYRKVVGKPENLKWWTKEYTNEKVPLVLDDPPENPVKQPAAIANSKEKTKKAAVIEFFLPKKTHLSIPLRELFKKNDDVVLIDISEVYHTRSELIEKMLTIFDDYLIRLTKENFTFTTSTIQVAKNLTYKEAMENALKRVAELEHEVAVLRMEREATASQRALECVPLNPFVSAIEPLPFLNTFAMIANNKRPISHQYNIFNFQQNQFNMNTFPERPNAKRLCIDLTGDSSGEEINENDSVVDVDMLSHPEVVSKPPTQVDQYESFKQFLIQQHRPKNV